MNDKLTLLNISVSVFFGWVIFELIVDLNNKRKLKSHLKNVIFAKDDPDYQEYYSIDINDINTEIELMNDDEKVHTLFAYKNSFEKRSSHCLDSYINKIHLYNNMRNTENSNLVFQQCGLSCNHLISLNKMLWYPLFFRCLFSYQNYKDINYFKSKYKVITDKIYKYKIYEIFSNSIEPKKNLLIFIGLGGFLYPFKSVIDLFIKHGYRVFIPIYGPCQASLDFDMECHEGEFQYFLYEYLHNKSIFNLEILCWSLGGILYKGFEKYCQLYKNNFLFDKYIEINKVYLIEPLIGTRGCSDTFFCQIRNYFGTLSLMNEVTNRKYHNLNYIFSYFLHTIVGFSSCVSFGYFSSVELIKTNNIVKLKYPRYLFVSSDDIVFNKDLDKSLIESSFDPSKIYFKKGYHGGWLVSDKILPILKKILE